MLATLFRAVLPAGIISVIKIIIGNFYKTGAYYIIYIQYTVQQSSIQQQYRRRYKIPRTAVRLTCCSWNLTKQSISHNLCILHTNYSMLHKVYSVYTEYERVLYRVSLIKIIFCSYCRTMIVHSQRIQNYYCSSVCTVYTTHILYTVVYTVHAMYSTLCRVYCCL